MKGKKPMVDFKKETLKINGVDTVLYTAGKGEPLTFDYKAPVQDKPGDWTQVKTQLVPSLNKEEYPMPMVGITSVPQLTLVPKPRNDFSLPVMPGFREMALRRMAAQRAGLVRDLVAQRQAAGLSQTEVAARMGTSQSAVARLESGVTDVRATTLERYAAAIGGEITWRLND